MVIEAPLKWASCSGEGEVYGGDMPWQNLWSVVGFKEKAIEGFVKGQEKPLELSGRSFKSYLIF